MDLQPLKLALSIIPLNYPPLPLIKLRRELSSAFNAFRSVMVGASGALYGVLVGFAMLFPNAQLMLLFPPIPVKAKFLVPILILADLFFGFSSYSIGTSAHFAHVGGAITGLAMMWYWKKQEFNNNRWDL